MKGKLLALIFLNIACEQTTTVSLEIFSKMISHRNLGLAYLEEERFNEPAEEFKALIHIAPEEPLGHANLGLAYLIDNKSRNDGYLRNAVFTQSFDSPIINKLSWPKKKVGVLVYLT
tara:strand:- start:57 stop:407 length:351 start_codon:yes stop_codon:yes gene_type:complete